jgi:Tol biopolymer transport system component
MESSGRGPSFAPDGQSLVFARNPSSSRNASAIYVIRTDGTLWRLTKERFASEPVWSPRGDLIVFRSDRDDDEGDLYVMRPDGSRQRRLTRNRQDAESLAWSPDGRFIAYAFYDGGIYAVPASGGPRRLVTRSGGSEVNPVWSPDGRYIAFVNEDNQSASVRSDIYLVTARGSTKRQLTKRYYNVSPSWSADGRRIAFAFFTRLEGPSRSGIAVVNVNGTGRRELTTGSDSLPVWQPVPR